VPSEHFADDLISRLRRLGHPLCLGLDPHLDRIPPPFRSGGMQAEDPATAPAVAAFLEAVLERAAPRIAVVKPQIAFFEQLGWRGLRVLADVLQKARDAGLLVILDAKRGDIGSTAAGYARSLLGADAPFPADALTINPWLGLDSLEPFLSRAESTGTGLFALVKTSNPGAADLQDLELAAGGSAGKKVYEHLAGLLAPKTEELRGLRTGWSSLGVVVGATKPEEAQRVRELLPRSLFLVPGHGAQGASAKDALRGFVAGPGGRLEGGVVNSSRAILFPPTHGDSAAAWESAFDGVLERATSELGEAVT